MKQMVKKVHYKISQDLFIRDKKHHESGVFYLPRINWMINVVYFV